MDQPVDDLAVLRAALGDLLAGFRKEAGLTQQELAACVGYSRVTVSCAESGHRLPAEAFWIGCEALLGTDGQLRRAYAQLVAVRGDRARQRTRRAEAERLGRLRSAGHGPVLRALTSALVETPEAGRGRGDDAAMGDLAAARTVASLVDAVASTESSERAAVMAAAHQSSENAGRAETSNVGQATLEQLDADVLRIANDYVHASPLPLFVELLRVRNRVYRLLEGHQKPADTTHLYLLAGAVCGLLANATTDLGHRDAAAEQARAAWTYGEIIGHNGLRAWTRGMQALIEYWSDHPRQALNLVQSGHRYADSPTAKVRLLNIEARVWSQLGDATETDRCMRAVAEVRDPHGDDLLHDQIGGVFAFDEAKSYYYAGATFIHLGQTASALEATRHAIRLYSAASAARRSFGPESLARIDAGTAHLIGGDIDGAAEVLRPVLTLPPELRIAQLSERLVGFRRVLAPQRKARQGRALDEHVEQFLTTSVATELPSPPTE